MCQIAKGTGKKPAMGEVTALTGGLESAVLDLSAYALPMQPAIGGTIMFTTEDNMEEVDISKLQDVFKESLMDVSASTDLGMLEIVEILEKIRVEKVGEIRKAVENLGKYDEKVEPLSMGLEKVIEATSVATDLNTDEITEILTEKSDASVEDLVLRLHEKSKHDRYNLCAY